MIQDFRTIKLDDNELNGAQITKLVDYHRSNIDRFEDLNCYYLNKNIINNRDMGYGKPNNKLSHNFAKYITDMATGYFMGKGVRYIIPDEQKEFNDFFYDILDEKYEKDSLYEIAKECSICGIAYELLYIDENSNLKTKYLDSNSVIPIFSTNVNEFLTSAIRLYENIDYFSDSDKEEFADYYTKSEIITFKKQRDTYVEIKRIKHNLSDVPMIIYLNNKELKGDFENVISLIDAYDKAQSDTSNDFEYFTDAYLAVIGASDIVDDDNEKIENMRNKRLWFLPEGSNIQWLVKNINDAAVENYKNRLYQNLFFLSQVPSLTDESFSMNSSGVAIAYKLIGLENLATTKENKFRASLKKKIKIIVNFINLKFNKNFTCHDVEIKFDRNVVQNLTEIIDNVVKLEGIVSIETLLSEIPFIKNVKDELDKIKEESEMEKDKIDKNLDLSELDWDRNIGEKEESKTL